MLINKVVRNYQDPDSMEAINKLTGMSAFETENWCDWDNFKEYPKLKKYITSEKAMALRTGEIDYIAFKLDY